MLHRLFGVCLSLVGLAVVSHASNPPTVPSRVVLSVLNAPIPAGGVAQVAVSNPDGNAISWQGNPLHVHQATGELVFPFDTPNTGLVHQLSAFATTVLTLPVPSAQPGAFGTFLLVFEGSARGVERLDIAAAAPTFPALHLLPGDGSESWRQHAAQFGGTDRWRLANAGTAPHTLGAGAALRVRRSIGEPILATMSLAGITLDAKSWRHITLPLSGLPAGPYLVESEWMEPTTGQTVVHRHGVRTNSAGLDLHLPGGHALPLGGVLPLALHWNGSYNSSPIYAVVAGWSAGSSWLGGHELPLAFGDPLVTASLTTDLFGTLINGRGAGLPVPLFPGIPGNLHEARNIWISAPIEPALIGFELRLAGIVYERTTERYLVSQPETVLLG